MTALKFPDDHFHLILCSHVLEHVPNDRLAMSELVRVEAWWNSDPDGADRKAQRRNTGGPCGDRPKDRIRLYGQFGHVRLYGRDYSGRLQEAGFHVKEDAMTERLSPEEVFRFGLLRSRLVHAGSK